MTAATDSEARAGASAPVPRSGTGPWSWQRRLAAALGLVAVLALAASWLALPYFVDGRAMLTEAGEEIRAERLGIASATARELVRFADGSGEAETDVLWAVPEYFAAAQATGAARDLEPDRYHVFLITETTHVTPLPGSPPAAVLRVDGREVAAVDIDGPSDLDHHRTTVVRFPLTLADGSPAIPDGTTSVELLITGTWPGRIETRVAGWALPLALPEATGDDIAPALVLALAGGLLAAVLTPCLLQMLVVYMSALGGMGAEAAAARAAGSGGGAGAARTVPLFALAFVGGFTVLYTGAGALIGGLGARAQGLFVDFDRPLAIGAGILILGLALWTAHRARVPVVCRIPLPGRMRGADSSGVMRGALLASAVALGCITCFSGAIVGTLLIYVGVLGSAGTGALVMLMFSLGVAVPFLAAAMLMARVRPLMDAMTRHARTLALVNVAVMGAFAVILITDNFHVVSDAIYPLLGLD